MVGGAPRGTVACGGYGGELCLRDPRSKMRAEVNLSSPAHSAGVQSIVRYSISICFPYVYGQFD